VDDAATLAVLEAELLEGERPGFASVDGYGASYEMPNGMRLLGSYHPSLRNTLTKRLNKVMFARVFVNALELAGLA